MRIMKIADEQERVFGY